MMRSWIILLLLTATLASAVEFSIQAPTDAIQNSIITASVILENTETIYGYEATITAPANYTSHQFTDRVAGATNSLIVVNATTVRAASVANTGIAPANTSVLDINYTLPDAGEIQFTITAKSYSQNGSQISTTTQDATINVTGNLLKVNPETTNQRTANVSICSRTDALSQISYKLAYDRTKIDITNATTAYTLVADGATVTQNNIPAQATCENIATFTFNITTQPGTTVSIALTNITTTPQKTVTGQDGTLKYNSFLLLCENITAYRNTTQEIEITLENYANLTQLNYSISTTLNITNVTGAGTISLTDNDVSINNPGMTRIFTAVPESFVNGEYTLAIEDIIGANTQETIPQTTEPTCKVTVADHCLDQDNDGYFAGPECTNITLDCDDTKDTVYPGATETCNARDDDCDGTIDEGTCTSSGGGGGGGGSSGSSTSSSASASTAGFVPFHLPTETATPTPETQEKEQPVQAELQEQETQEATEIKPETKKINLVAHAMGALTLLGAGLLIVYEYLKHRHPH